MSNIIVIANAISISAIVLFLLPWYFYVATKKRLFLWLGLAASLADGSTKLWKYIFGVENIFGRPLGACDCDILCRNGDQTRKPGFPSGHMTVTSVVIFTLIGLYPSYVCTMVGLCTILVMGWARYVKRCHNMMQILAGTFYGFFVATFFLAFT